MCLVFCAHLLLYCAQLLWLKNIASDLMKFGYICFQGELYEAAIWQIPELYGELNSPQLEKITPLGAHGGKIKW